MYLPQAVGNKFVYYYVWTEWHSLGGSSGSYRVSAKITEDTIINNKHYYFYNTYPGYNLSNVWIRLDSLTHSIYRFNATNTCQYYSQESLVDSLDIITGYYNSCNPYHSFSGNDTMTIFGIFGQTKRFEWNFVSDYFCKYHSIFGIVSFSQYYSQGANGYSNQGTLIGCSINGIIYGDTTLTSVNQTGIEFPKNFSLFQNYPNPFNPSTKIKFDLKENGRLKMEDVKLTIYDILGREVQTLVNEQLQPGTYEVTFDESNLPSGIYFYQLKAGDYIETRKMLLIK
jgi:hypothetical protein